MVEDIDIKRGIRQGNIFPIFTLNIYSWKFYMELLLTTYDMLMYETYPALKNSLSEISKFNHISYITIMFHIKQLIFHLRYFDSACAVPFLSYQFIQVLIKLKIQ